MNKYKKLAKAILSIEEYDINLSFPYKKLEESISISSDFYNDFFKDYDIFNVDENTYFYTRRYLKEYNGTCSINEYKGNKAVGFKVLTPKEEDIRNIITITHEKAHIYHALNNKKTSEEVPSFMEILQAINLDETLFFGIKKDNINYKIRQAKIASKVYLDKTKLFYSDKTLEYQINYMLDFIRTIILLKNYFNNPNEVKKLIYMNLFENKQNPVVNYNFIDNKDEINKELEFIKKI